MPTENRSSNTEMVSVPREQLQAWQQRFSKAQMFQQSTEVQAALTQPAALPHPEPIAWMVGTAFWWTEEEADRDAAEVGQPVIGLGPMIDAAEVERLSAENEQLREVIKHSDSNIQRQSLRISNQRAQLAEQESLLREVLEAFKLEADGSCINPGRDFIRPWAAKLAALSASAEPSAPVEHDHDALVAAVCVLRSQGLGNLSEAVEAVRAALVRKPS